MSNRLARSVFQILKYGQECVDKSTPFYEERLRELLKKKAASLDPRLIEAEEVA